MTSWEHATWVKMAILTHVVGKVEKERVPPIQYFVIPMGLFTYDVSQLGGGRPPPLDQP